MTPEYILRKNLCRPAHCSDATVDALMRNYPDLRAWIQTDPRGGTIYLCKPENATDSLYTRGVFVA